MGTGTGSVHVNVHACVATVRAASRSQRTFILTKLSDPVDFAKGAGIIADVGVKLSTKTLGYNADIFINERALVLR